MSKPETNPNANANPNANPNSPPRAEAPRFDFAGFEPWVQAATANTERLQATLTSYWNELAGFENAAYERARTASNDLAKLTTDSIAYASAIAAEWRRVGLEATRKLTEQLARS